MHWLSTICYYILAIIYYIGRGIFWWLCQALYMLLMEGVQVLMYCLNMVCYFILALSYLIGRGIFWLLCQACNYIGDSFGVLAIGEEFHRFMLELDVSVSESLRYVRSSINSGIGGVVDALLLFCKNISHFFTSTKQQSKLLATECGRCVEQSILLVRNALLLIADWAWWLLSFIPKMLNCLISVGDYFVYSISGTVWLLTTIVRNDIFRFTIALVVIYVLTKQVWRLLRLLITSLENLNHFSRAMSRPMYPVEDMRLRRRVDISGLATNANLEIHTPLSRQSRQLSRSTACAENLLESQCCVVCQDKLKCVVLLPCKHLCVCDECANLIVDRGPINAQCPLCRTNIRQLMTVYI